MKLLTSLLATFALCLGLVASAASQATADPAATASQRGHRVERLLRRFDANGDGALDRGELRQVGRAHAARRDPARRQQRFARLVARFDLDRDGRLGPQEVPPALAQRLLRFDLNRDGWVDAAEVGAAGPRRRR